jgi:hypothetical protein
VERPPTSCEGFPGEDAGGLLSSGLLGGGCGLRRRSVARRGGGRGPPRGRRSVPRSPVEKGAAHHVGPFPRDPDRGTDHGRIWAPDPILPPIGIGQGTTLFSLEAASPPPIPARQPGRRRRLVNAVTPHHLLSFTPYIDALMAGRGRHIRRRGIGGRGPQEGGRGTTAIPASGTSSHGEAPATDRGQGTVAPRGRGAILQPAQAAGANAPDRARGAGPGRGRGRDGGPAWRCVAC